MARQKPKVAEQFAQLFSAITMANGHSDVASKNIYELLFVNDVLPQSICSPSTKLEDGVECFFTKEEYNATISQWHEDQDERIRSWYKPKFADVAPRGNYPDGTAWVKVLTGSGVATTDKVEPTPDNHNALKKGAVDQIGNMRKGYISHCINEQFRFQEECIEKGINDLEGALAEHPIFGKATGSNGKSLEAIANAATSKKKPLARLAGNLDTSQSIIVGLVGAGKTRQDDNGALLFEDDIRDQVPVDLVELLESKRDADFKFQSAMLAFDLPEDVISKIGKFFKKESSTGKSKSE